MKSSFNKQSILLAVIVTSVVFSACTKAEYDDSTKAGDPPPVPGGFVNSNEVAPANLIAHFAFENSVSDEKNNVTGGVASGTTSFVAGRKGMAYQGSTNGLISYASPGTVAALTSFTVSMWINTGKHDGGAQGVFGLAKQDGSFWGNFFMLIEGNNSSSNRMFFKLHFEKNNATWVEHWVEPNGDLRPDDMYNGWRHVAWTYDEANSTVTRYINGQKVNLPDNVAIRKANPAGDLLGALQFKNATKFVIGGYQNHLGTPFNSPESWMLNYTGKLDEFRIFNKALNAQEINAIAVLERQGR